MTMSKKVLSVVMALLMLASCVVTAGAYTYAPANTTGEVVISTVADKTTVNPGDVVTFDIHIDPGSKTNLAGSGTVIAYNGDQLTPVGKTIPEFRTYVGEHAATYANQNSTAGNMNFNVASLRNFTDEEKALFTKAIQFVGGSTSAANRWNPIPGESYVQFQMTVSDSVKPGDEIWIGVPEAAYAMGAANITYYGDSTRVTRTAMNEFNLTNSMVKLTVAGGEVAGPVLTKASSQVKMTATSASTVADAFQFRVISSISAADWDTYFANTGKADATANAITNVGFVAYKGTTGFNLDTAKAVVAGTAADGYQVATTDYIKHVEGSDAQFGCLLKITSAETRSDVTYIAFAQYLDAEGAPQVLFYADSYQALLNSNYTGIVGLYLHSFPYAG